MSIVEIRAAEGGDDAKLLVCEQFRIYCKFARRRGL
jgi:protein subunit release factor A